VTERETSKTNFVNGFFCVTRGFTKEKVAELLDRDNNVTEVTGLGVETGSIDNEVAPEYVK
jgi:hypothetical protein